MHIKWLKIDIILRIPKQIFNHLLRIEERWQNVRQQVNRNQILHKGIEPVLRGFLQGTQINIKIKFYNKVDQLRQVTTSVQLHYDYTIIPVCDQYKQS